MFKTVENVCVIKTTEFFYKSVEGFIEIVKLIDGGSEVILSSTNPDDEEYVIQIDDIPKLITALKKAYTQAKETK